MGWWNDWKTLQVLPFPGSILEQPAWVVEAFQVTEAAWEDARARMEQAQQSDLQRELERMRRK